MSKIAFILRKANAKGESGVTVRHSYKSSPPYEKATGVAVPSKYFNSETGKVSKLPNSPELNAEIELVRSTVETAARNLVGKGVEPTRDAVGKEYERVKSDRERAVRVAPKIHGFFLNHIDELKEQLNDLLQQVEVKRKEIELAELQLGVHINNLLSKYINQYVEEKRATAATNTTRLYANIANVVTAFNPTWNIQDVTPATLLDFENWMIKEGKKNLTITDTITKVKTVVYHFAKQLGIDAVDIREHVTNVKKKRNPNTVFLSKLELQDLIALSLTNEVDIMVRDRFVLMSLIGVRYSDSIITPDNILNNELLFSTEKTDTDIIIPISKQVQSILDKYDNNIPAYQSQYFNIVIKRVCKQVESLQHKIIIKSYEGANKPVKKAVQKWEAISAHVARKTFINLALIQGVNPVVIAGIVGHEGTDLIMNVYGSREAGKEKLMELLD